MGVFDKVEKDAEDMMRADPKPARQAGQLGDGQPGQDMRAAQHMIGKQRAPQDQGQDLPGNDQAEDPSTASGDPGQDLNTGPGQGQDQGQRQGR